MALFDFGKHSGKDAAKIASLSHHLAVATATDATSIFNASALIGKLLSNADTSAVTNPRNGPPEGWSEVDPRSMGFSGDQIGYNDFILVQSPVLGKVDGTIQLKVYQSNDGQLAVSWAATNNPLDIADFTALNAGTAGPFMDGPLSKIAHYAQSQGMTADDVLVTGYSLGAAYTVIMADNQETLAGGFFNNATYAAHNGPLAGEGIPNLLNFGYENDIVYRAAGNFDTIDEALKAAGPLLEGSDFNFEATADNVVIFDGAYASPLFPFGAFSILNLAGSWYGHVSGLVTDAIDRIGKSEFYELTNRDSAVIVSTLGKDKRWNTWVEDRETSATSDHYGRSAFLIGTEFDDKIRDGKANDFLDGLGGDDLFRVSTGMDRIHGGQGTDTLRLRGNADEWDVYRLADGTLAFIGDDGLKVATGIERVEFEGIAVGNSSLFNKAFEVRAHELSFDGNWFERWFNDDVAYSHATEGTAGADTLTGKVIFARDGDDVVTGTKEADVLSGGNGSDVLTGGGGADRLYGGANDDVLVSDGGDDVLNGGHGRDTFVFNSSSHGTVQIEDFSDAMGETDVLLVEGMTGAELKAAASQTQEGVTIALEHVTIELEGAKLSDLTDSFAIA